MDVFSLGVVMFICFTKTPPFGLGAPATNAILRGEYDKDAMSTIRPAAARELCKKMMAHKQEDRYSIEEVLQDRWLQEAAGIC